MVERMHRTLKAALKCSPETPWTLALPGVLLGLRTTFKEILQASPAEMVFGTSLRIPGEFMMQQDTDKTPPSDFVLALRRLFKAIRPVPASHHAQHRLFVFADLATCDYVFWRVDSIRKPLEQPYTGPHKVIRRINDRTSVVDVNGVAKTLSTDQLKPAYIDYAAPQPKPDQPTTTRSTLDQDDTQHSATQRRTWWTSSCPQSCAHATLPCQEEVIVGAMNLSTGGTTASRIVEIIRREEFANARRRLRRAIKANKRLCRRQLCDEADCEVWSKPYRVVISRVRALRTSPTTAPYLVPRTVPRHAISGKGWHRGTKEYCAIITLDMRNAFNKARWNKILIALNQMEVPAYLLRIVSSYFCDRVLEFTTDDGIETYDVTAGVPSGSVLGPIFWNVMYDRILRLKLPGPEKIVGFANDIAVTVVANHLELVEFYLSETIRLVRAALTDLGLQTADQKTKVLLVTSRKVRKTITLRAGDPYITLALCIRYLGVHIDARLRFDEHLPIVSDKANRVAGALLGLMPNIGGPRNSRLRLCASVVDSIHLYSAPAWSEAAKTHDYVRRAASIHRRACLRVICGFCSISHEASYVLASISPLELLIGERRGCIIAASKALGVKNELGRSRNGRPNGPARRRVGEPTDSSRISFHVLKGGTEK
ncbi:unnamed protein product [Trichogramma brassicae]|uniref:Reverse transcriptase domain-containing protein n=1 Tax=Trichogramma brassicae TaxID=86971 RepID=A0A6H5I3B9_9HYME|nr:unnamed protein product [Trichogramma brassicae]